MSQDNQPRIHMTPETDEQLTARYPAALEPVYTKDTEGENRPGRKRQHLFDTEDGWRFCVSRLRVDEETIFAHMSTSHEPSSEACLTIRDVMLSAGPDALLDLIIKRFRAATGEKRPVHFLGFSEEKMIPHFMIEET